MNYLRYFLFILLSLVSVTIAQQTNQRPLIFIFAHGLGGNASQVNWYNGIYEKSFNIVGSQCISFDFPDVIDATKINLAQEVDIEALHQICQNYIATHEIVLVGLSRGASTIINYASKYPESLKALVVEAPFASIQSVINNRLRQLHINWIPGMQSFAHTFVSRYMFPGYKKDGIHPIDSIKKIAAYIPILFIHSKKDQLINCDDSSHLYRLRRECGCTNAYYVELKHCKHAMYQADKRDITRYYEAVDCFYQQCGIVIS